MKAVGRMAPRSVLRDGAVAPSHVTSETGVRAEKIHDQIRRSCKQRPLIGCPMIGAPSNNKKWLNKKGVITTELHKQASPILEGDPTADALLASTE